MKKNVLLLLCFLVGMSLVADESFGGVGLSYVNTGRSFKGVPDTQNLNIGGFGVSFTQWTGIEEGFTGVYDGAVLLPVSLSLSRSSASLDSFAGMKVMFDSNGLLGYTFLLEDSSLFVGAGLHMNGVMLTSSGYASTYASYMSYTLGGGISSRLLVPVADDMLFTIAASYAYDFLETMYSESAGAYVGGSTFAITAGLFFIR